MIRSSRWLRVTLRLAVWPIIVGAIVVSQLPRFREATVELNTLSFTRLVVGFVFVMASIGCYSGLTRDALNDPVGRIPHQVIYRIQLSTRALSNVVPGGNATASALGFRLLTRAGASKARAGVALATAGLTSAAVLNCVFWVALAGSFLTRTTDRAFVVTASLGLLLLALIVVIVSSVVRGSDRLVRVVRSLARRTRFDPDRAAALVIEIRQRVGDLRRNRPLLRRLLAWSTAQVALDVAALWVFLSAFDIRLDPIVLVLVFGAANIAAALPVTPGGVGIVEGIYITSLVQVGFTFHAATLGIAAYRLAQYAFPIVIGALSYLTLRAGPWRLASFGDDDVDDVDGAERVAAGDTRVGPLASSRAGSSPVLATPDDPRH